MCGIWDARKGLTHQTQAIGLLRALMEHPLSHPEEIPPSYRQDAAPLVVQAADYVAGMTDRFALATYGRLFGADAAAATGLPGA